MLHSKRRSLWYFSESRQERVPRDQKWEVEQEEVQLTDAADEWFGCEDRNHL